MSLGRSEWLLGDNQIMSDAYCLMTVLILAAFQIVAMNVGSNDPGVYDITPDLRNDRMSILNIMADVGDDVPCIRCVMMSVGNSSIDIRNVLTNVRNG